MTHTEEEAGQDDSSAEPSADYREMVRQQRKRRRDVKMTGLPPGTASRIMARPPIAGSFSSRLPISTPESGSSSGSADESGQRPKNPGSPFHRRAEAQAAISALSPGDAGLAPAKLQEQETTVMPREFLVARLHAARMYLEELGSLESNQDEVPAEEVRLSRSLTKFRHTSAFSAALAGPALEESPPAQPGSIGIEPDINRKANESATLASTAIEPSDSFIDTDTVSNLEKAGIKENVPINVSKLTPEVSGDSQQETISRTTSRQEPATAAQRQLPQSAGDLQISKQPSYHTELIAAGTEIGAKRFVDSYGRQIEAYYAAILTLPEQVFVQSQDEQFAQSFQLYPGGQYWGTRQDEDGKVVARMNLDTLTGIITGENLLTGSLLRLELDGDRMEQIRTQDAIKETIYFADGRNAKVSTGSAEVVMRYCEYTKGGWLIRRDDHFRSGTVQCSFFDPNLRVPNAQRRLRAVTTTLSRNGITEKTHEDYTYLAPKSTSVRTKGVYVDSSGKITEMHFAPGDNAPLKVKITDRSGFVTQLARSASRMYEGTCTDRSGKVLEEVSFDGKVLLYRNKQTGLPSRTEEFALLSINTGPAPVPAIGSCWNPGRAAIESIGSGRQKYVRYTTGREEIVEADGAIKWNGGAGERSFAAPGGEILVTNSEGGAIRIHRDSTVELKHAIGQEFTKVPLSSSQLEFLQRYGGKIDLRDFAEMLRLWLPKPDRLDAILRQLDYIASGRYREVSPDQVEIIRDCLMHHIAYPDEIFQGHATTSGAAVAQRMLASNLPFRYAAIVRECLTGRLSLSGMQAVAVDVPNALQDDLSGRDAASRLFQTIAMQCALHPRYCYRNEWSGLGREANWEPGMPTGLTAEDVSSMLYRLSGTQTCVVEVSTIDELLQAFRISGTRAIIVGVDGNEYPFGTTGQCERHFVTISGFIEGRRPRVLVSNQYGSTFDHSTRKTAIDARMLLSKMCKCAALCKERRPIAIIHGGRHGERFGLKDGTLQTI